MSTELLTLLQIADSAFPTGAFAHSYGMETCVQSGAIHDAATFERFARATLVHGIGKQDAIAVAVSHRANGSDDFETIRQADELLTAAKLPTEARDASVRIGRQFLRTCRDVFADSRLDRFASAELDGHHAVNFGVVASILGVGIEAALIGYLRAHAAGQASAAVRLVPLGATAAQRVIHSLNDDVQRVASAAARSELADFGGFAPALDIHAMRHKRLHSRLFMS